MEGKYFMNNNGVIRDRAGALVAVLVGSVLYYRDLELPNVKDATDAFDAIEEFDRREALA